MRRHLIVPLLLWLLILPSSANLGETVAQCISRYGLPTHYTETNAQLPFGTITFVAGGYGLIIFILDGKEVGARVSKSDKSSFNDAERQTIMNADTGGSSWTPVPSGDPTCLAWSRADHATLLYDQEKHMLIFTSVAMADALHAKPASPH